MNQPRFYSDKIVYRNKNVRLQSFRMLRVIRDKISKMVGTFLILEFTKINDNVFVVMYFVKKDLPCLNI